MTVVLNSQVTIIGAGILGLFNALLYAKKGCQVTVIDKLEGRKVRYKVGESQLMFTNPFLRTIGEMDDFLQNRSFPKQGVWFALDHEGSEDLNGLSEIAFLGQPVPPVYKETYLKDERMFRAHLTDRQMVRPEIEAEMLERVKKYPNIVMIEGLVSEIELGEGEEDHLVSWNNDACNQTGTIRTRWILDCSGRKRLLAKKFGHAQEFEDDFKTTALWGQFGNVAFDDSWACEFQDGLKLSRDYSTYHLWGDGYWIWVIRLSNNRLSLGVQILQEKLPAERKKPKEVFWDIIGRHPKLMKLVSEQECIDFAQFANVQYTTDTFVTARRYGMVGDAASIIDAYYSQGISLACCTSWHIGNIVEDDVIHGKLNRDYVERVNRYTRQDWLMMRNVVRYKYRNPNDGRFFILSHLLDWQMFTSALLNHYRISRLLIDTNGRSSGFQRLHDGLKRQLSRTFFFSFFYPWGYLLSPERIQSIQGSLQKKMHERAMKRSRGLAGRKMPVFKFFYRLDAALPRIFKLRKLNAVVDLTRIGNVSAAKWLLMPRKGKPPIVLYLLPLVQQSTFLLGYLLDKFSKKAAVETSGAPSGAEASSAAAQGDTQAM